MDFLLGRLSGVAMTECKTSSVDGELAASDFLALEIFRASSPFIASLPAVVVQADRNPLRFRRCRVYGCGVRSMA
jgi:hypothetical protein